MTIMTVITKLHLSSFTQGDIHLSLPGVSLRSTKAGQSEGGISIQTEGFKLKLETKGVQVNIIHSSTFRTSVSPEGFSPRQVHSEFGETE